MPPPLPVSPTVQPAPNRPVPRRWPGYLLLLGVVTGLSLALAYGLRTLETTRDSFDRSAGVSHTKSLLMAQETAWNRGDLDGFMAGYWNDERLTFSSGGTVTRGWQGTIDRYKKRYQADGKEMGTLTFSELEFVPLAADVVLARGRWALVFTKSEERPSGLFTLIVRKHSDGWKVDSDHTSVAEPAKKN